MATITQVNTNATGPVSITPTVLGASDALVYSKGVSKFLVINNVTVGAITPNIDGDGAGSSYLVGVGPVDISAGYTIASIPAGGAAVIDLDSIRSYLQGTIAVTGGDGAEAYVLAV